MTITIQQLEAENATLKSQLAKYEACMNPSERLVLRLREQLAAALKDAERLKDMLRTNVPHDCYVIHIYRGDCHQWNMVATENAVFVGEIAKEMLASIDAAIAQEKK